MRGIEVAESAANASVEVKGHRLLSVALSGNPISVGSNGGT
jgi:hypothetical protein